MDPVALTGALRDTARAALGAREGQGASADGASVPFAAELRSAFADANAAVNAAEEQGTRLAAGETDVIETMVALGKADLSLRFVTALRNRALEAYREIMRLQV